MINAHVNANEIYKAKPITILPHIWVGWSCRREEVVSFHALILHEHRRRRRRHHHHHHHLGLSSRLISSP